MFVGSDGGSLRASGGGSPISGGGGGGSVSSSSASNGSLMTPSSEAWSGVASGGRAASLSSPGPWQQHSERTIWQFACHTGLSFLSRTLKQRHPPRVMPLVAHVLSVQVLSTHF